MQMLECEMFRGLIGSLSFRPLPLPPNPGGNRAPLRSRMEARSFKKKRTGLFPKSPKYLDCFNNGMIFCRLWMEGRGGRALTCLQFWGWGREGGGWLQVAGPSCSLRLHAHARSARITLELGSSLGPETQKHLKPGPIQSL